MARSCVRSVGVLVVSLAALTLVGSPAFAEWVNVNCMDAGIPPPGSKVFTSLSGAIAYLNTQDTSQQHGVRVYGTCTETNPVKVPFYRNLTLAGLTTPAVVQLALAPGAGDGRGLLWFFETTASINDLTLDAGGGGPSVVQVTRGSHVGLRRSVVRNAYGGVSVSSGGTVFLEGTRIEDIGNTALRVDAPSFAYVGRDDQGGTESVITTPKVPNGGLGIVVGGDLQVLNGTTISGFGNGGIRCLGGRVTFYSEGPGVAITNNRTGIHAVGCYLSMNGPVQVSDNLVRGVYLSHSTLITQWGIGPQWIERNGNGDLPGIYVGNSSLLNLSNGRIADNKGPGMLVETSSTASIYGIVVEGNTGYGIQVEDFSTIELQVGQPVNLVRANGGADVCCGSMSAGRGDSSGVGTMKCSTFGKTK